MTWLIATVAESTYIAPPTMPSPVLAVNVVPVKVSEAAVFMLIAPPALPAAFCVNEPPVIVIWLPFSLMIAPPAPPVVLFEKVELLMETIAPPAVSPAPLELIAPPELDDWLSTNALLVIVSPVRTLKIAPPLLASLTARLPLKVLPLIVTVPP